MRMVPFLLAVLMVLSSHANAQWYDRDTGAVLPETDSRKSMDGLGAELFVTAKYREFFWEWENTPADHGPTVQPIDKIRRGDVVAAFVVFFGCGGPATPCDAVADFKILKPDGSVYADPPALPVLSQPVPRAGVLLLSDQYLMIQIEPDDPFGTYIVLAEFLEPSTGRALGLRREFEVIN